MEHMGWKNYLHDYLKEELADSVKYAELARENHFDVRQMFHDMAEEEYEHACAIWHMMEENGLTAGMDKHELFREAKAALYK